MYHPRHSYDLYQHNVDSFMSYAGMAVAYVIITVVTLSFGLGVRSIRWLARRVR